MDDSLSLNPNQGHYPLITCLNLILYYIHLDHPVLQVLSERQGDKMAQDFVKKQKERLLS